MVRIEKIASANPRGLILREKDLSEEAYRELAGKVLAICQRYKTFCILHNYVEAALELNCGALHLPLPILRNLSAEKKGRFTILGASCHSIEDAKEAEKLGCTYITAGHIFETDCKMGLPGRGLDFLKEVCERVSIPVYAIGGISAENIESVRRCGAAGACIMSGAMVCESVQEYIASSLRS